MQRISLLIAILTLTILPALAIPAGQLTLLGKYADKQGWGLVRENGGGLELLARDAGGDIRWDGARLRAFSLAGAGDAYTLPKSSAFKGAAVVFARNGHGAGISCALGERKLTRSFYYPELGKRFRITPTRPLAELKKAALAATPPREKGKLAPDLVDARLGDKAIHLDIRYATGDNFLGIPLYPAARAFLQRPAARALANAQRSLRKQGYGLVVFDAYRPWYITKMMWDATPAGQKTYVANPAQGSRHNRGCAVDLSLYDLHSGKTVNMGSGYDEFTPRANVAYPGGTSQERNRRAILRKAMTQSGFRTFAEEWWHFDFPAAKRYPIMNIPFSKVAQK